MERMVNSATDNTKHRSADAISDEALDQPEADNSKFATATGLTVGNGPSKRKT